MLRFEPKYVTKHKQVELRATTENGTQILVIVSLGGWEYSHESRTPKNQWQRNNNNFGVRLSMNGPAWLTIDDLDELSAAVGKAKQVLLLDNPR